MAMSRWRGDSADAHSAGHPNPSGSDSRRTTTTKREPREVRDEQVPRRISGQTMLEEHAVAAPRFRHWTNTVRKRWGSRVSRTAHKSWLVSISSAGALDMTHCDFSVRSARDEMRHIIASSKPDVIIGSDKDLNRGCKKKDKDHTEFFANGTK